MVLTDAKIRAARPAEKDLKLFDGGGLYLLVKPNGGRYWKMKYRFMRRERKLSFKSYPEVSLKEARALRDAARRVLRSGVDPMIAKQRLKGDDAHTFEGIAREWLELQAKPPKKSKARPLAPITIRKATSMLETYIFPRIGRRDPRELEASDFLHPLKKVEELGLHETAHRLKWRCGQILRYATATGRAKHDVTADLRGALVPVVSTSHAALTDPADVGRLLRAISSYDGQPSTQYALKLLPYHFLRSSEYRFAKWREIDFENSVWRVPAERMGSPGMKMKEAHLVPLATQVVTMLHELQAITGRNPDDLIFPGLKRGRPLSDNTINSALRGLGYSTVEQQTGHGFRTVADTLLNEQGWPPDVIELQLAHKEPNKVRRVYNKAKRLTERKKMMQAWADYLDGLRAGGNVVSIFSKASA